MRIPTITYDANYKGSGTVGIFDNLKVLLEDSLTRFVVNLKSFKGMKQLMDDIMKQLIHCQFDDIKDLPKLSDSSLTTMCCFYSEFCQSNNKDGSSTSPPVVFVIENIEEFPSSLLGDLVTILKLRLKDFPVIFLIGSSFNTTHIIPTTISHQLKITNIPNDPLNTIIPSVLSMLCFDASLPVHLSIGLCGKLLTYLEGHLVPMYAFKNQIMYTMFEHFYWQPLSVLCNKGHDDCKRIITGDFCDMIRATESVMEYINTLPHDEQVHLLTDDVSIQVMCMVIVTD
jgi:hypothetical protein